MAPLHELDPTNRFTGLADAYARFRPSYPVELIRALLAESPSTSPLLLDCGAGTGISSRLLADCGARVIACDPNADMLLAGAPHPAVRRLVATAEALPLRARGVDAVTAFQAYHWFDAARALPEFRRVLKAGGFVAAVWYERDRSDPLTEEYTLAVKRASENHPAEDRTREIASLYESPLFGEVTERVFPYVQRLDYDGLLGRIASTSYLPHSGARYDELVARMRELAREFGDAEGRVALRHNVRLYVSRAIQQ